MSHSMCALFFWLKSWKLPHSVIFQEWERQQQRRQWWQWLWQQQRTATSSVSLITNSLSRSLALSHSDCLPFIQNDNASISYYVDNIINCRFTFGIGKHSFKFIPVGCCIKHMVNAQADNSKIGHQCTKASTTMAPALHRLIINSRINLDFWLFGQFINEKRNANTHVCEWGWSSRNEVKTLIQMILLKWTGRFPLTLLFWWNVSIGSDFRFFLWLICVDGTMRILFSVRYFADNMLPVT